MPDRLNKFNKERVMKKSHLKSILGAAVFSAALCSSALVATATDYKYYGFKKHFFKKSFNRISVFPVFKNTDIDKETVAEIVAATKNGLTLAYTDSEEELIGFVDIKNPQKPLPAGTVKLSGEPTSVAVLGNKYALAAVNTSADFVNTSGELAVIDIATKTIVKTLDLGGQPDAIAISKDGRYAAIAIENERDEDLGNGEPPQQPAGFLVIVDLVGGPANWTTRKVDFTGVSDLFPSDPEPEYVDINDKNIAVVTLQENNHIVLVNLKKGKIIRDFTAGTVDLKQIDTEEEDPALITLNTTDNDVEREPDGVSWINKRCFATADEGDLNGGSRGFTIFNKKGKVKFTSGNTNDHLAVRFGHYPDDRSGNKGNEPENVEYARFGKDEFLFVGSERSSIIFVYKLYGCKAVYKQTLPAGVGPEGLLAIPSRGLFVAASEVDDRGDKIRSVLNIYKLQRGEAKYPTVVSKNRPDGTPIPWGALSGLAIGKYGKAYSLHDSFYQQSRIFKMQLGYKKPAKITGEIVLRDSKGLLAKIPSETPLVNADGTVNIDGEGISLSKKGGFWIASEGDDSPKFPNMLLKVSAYGDIEKVVTLPASTQARMIRFGFEGVAEAGQYVYVAFQREWNEDPDNHVRIGRYDMYNGEWKFFYYPIDLPKSANGGWVGLSDIVSLGYGKFAVIERDNQGGPDAAIKKIYKFSVASLTPLKDTEVGTTPNFPVVTKKLVRDLVPDLKATGGLVLEKIEGLAVNQKGTAFVINDNDGVDDSNGETQLLRLKGLFK